MTLYNDLGVSKNATKDAIKKAYKSKANKDHPDKKGGSTEKFKTLAHAYDILSHQEKKKRYDATGDDGAKGDEVLETLAALFSVLIEENIEGDLIKITKEKLKYRKQQLNTESFKVSNRKETLEKKLGRIINTEGISLFETLLVGKIDQLEVQHKQLKHSINIVDKIDLVLKHYSDSNPDEIFSATNPSFSPLFYSGA